jgi:hypothetical protein
MKSSQSGIKRHPPPGSQQGQSNYDFITSPLTSKEQAHLANKQGLGSELGQGVDIEDIVMIAGCTWRASKYLSSSKRDIIVVGMGNGRIGAGAKRSDFGTSGVSPGYVSALQAIAAATDVGEEE